MKKIIISCISGLLVFISCVYSFAETAKVGGYTFPPFVEQNGQQFTGITLDLIEAMNKFQDKYQFEFFPTTSKRRYRDFDEGKYDFIFFENILWGWDKKDICASKVFLKGGEVYITKSDPSKKMTWFENFKGKTIAGYLGYHYGFAGFNADEIFLKENFNMEFSSTHEGNIIKVLRGRIDIAVITKSYLDKYLKQHPETKTQIMISDKYDQTYEHTILMRKNSRPSLEEINILLDKMKNSKILDKIWDKNGIKHEN